MSTLLFLSSSATASFALPSSSSSESSPNRNLSSSESIPSSARGMGGGGPGVSCVGPSSWLKGGTGRGRGGARGGAGRSLTGLRLLARGKRVLLRICFLLSAAVMDNSTCNLSLRSFRSLSVGSMSVHMFLLSRSCSASIQECRKSIWSRRSFSSRLRISLNLSDRHSTVSSENLSCSAAACLVRLPRRSAVIGLFLSSCDACPSLPPRLCPRDDSSFLADGSSSS
mmetsp:Transcript_2922/g.9852  ORF Transcript_2922/g.9852 Transcript_2922/m.9852 type:complete len:226 (+) Transcript_2922:703-1380(+)